MTLQVAKEGTQDLQEEADHEFAKVCCATANAIRGVQWAQGDSVLQAASNEGIRVQQVPAVMVLGSAER